MQLGIFAKTFPRPTLESALDAVVQHGFNTVQFNFACAGIPSMPDRIAPELTERVRSGMSARHIAMAAISGTFNMIHPDLRLRRDGLCRLREMASACKQLSTSVITLCTGTLDPTDMWRHHRDNHSDEAWRDLLESMDAALEFAADFGVTLAVEPEANNVVDSAPKARRLLDEVQSPNLKIIIDPANLFRAGELAKMREVLDEAFELLGSEVVIAHAKDLVEEAGEIRHVAAGRGSLDYEHYGSCLRRINFHGPLILHGLLESEVTRCLDFLRQTIFNS